MTKNDMYLSVSTSSPGGVQGILDGYQGSPRRLLGCLLLALFALPWAAFGQPQLDGDFESVVSLRPADCPTCTASQRNLLENGMKLLRHRLKQETVAPGGDVCIASASLARDMSVLTFEAYRRGDVSLGRWQDYVKARAAIAGGVSGNTRRLLLDRYREEAVSELSGFLEPSDLELFGRQMEIFGAAQFSRLYDELARGNWNVQSWQDVLLASPVGFNPVVDGVLGVRGTARQVLDRLVIDSGFQHTWQEGQLWHLSSLPGDFEVSTIPSLRDFLREDYQAAVAADLEMVMANGCGSEAGTAMRQEAIQLTNGYGIVTAGNKAEYVGPEDLPEVDGGTVVVIGKAPGCGCGTGVGGIPGAQGGGGNRPGGGGGGGDDGAPGGGGGGGETPQRACNDNLNNNVRINAALGKRKCKPSHCTLNEAAMDALRTANGGKEPEVCKPRETPPPSPPAPPPPNLDSIISRLCRAACRPDEYVGYEITGSVNIGAQGGPGTQPFTMGGGVETGFTCQCR